MSKKNQGRTLLIAAGVLVLLGGTYVGVTQIQKRTAAKKADREAEESEALEQELSIYDFDSADVTAISWKSTVSELSFAYDETDEAWYEVSNPDYPLMQTYISGIATTVANLKAASVLEDTLDNVADYGLENPDCVIRLTKSDGEEIVLNFGLYNSYTNQYYMYAEGDSHIYMMGSTLVNYASYTLDQMLSVASVSLPSTDEVKALSVEGFDEAAASYAIDYSETDGLTYAWYPYDYWYYEREDGVRVSADSDTVDSLLSNACSLSLSSCENYDADAEELEGYGLNEDAPSTARISYTYSYEETAESTDDEGEDDSEEEETVVITEEIVILVGNLKEAADEESEDMYYVREEGSDIVYIVKASDIENLTGFDTHELANKGYAMILSSNIDSIDLSFDEDQTIHYEVLRSTETDEDGNEITTTTYEMNGTEIDSTYVIAILYELTALGADRCIRDTDELVEYAPELEITYHTYDCEGFDEVVIGFTPYNDNYDMVTVNGANTLFINKLEVESMVSDLGEALDVLDMLREAETETESETLEITDETE